MIQIENLCKTYITKKQGRTTKIEAVKNLTLECNSGEIFGLLGPNGAGKTTTLRCISTLIKPTSGRISVGNYDVIKNEKKVRSIIGFLTSDMRLDGFFTPDYLVEYFGRLNKMSPQKIKRRKEELFTELGMDEFAGIKVDKLSTGMQQKTALAVTLIHNPDVIIFDEPTNGLDVITAKTVTDFLRKSADEGKTVLISTHMMSVAEKICDQIGILIHGELRELGSLSEILANNEAKSLDEVFFKHVETAYD
jgi:sodium transport system ATP-binding protein